MVGQSSNYIERTSGETGNVVARNLEDFITKAKSIGGYYIGRYEAGKVNGNENTFNIKKGQTVYNRITQSDAAELARNLYNGNIKLQSDLINSYAWDTAIIFIQTFSGDTDYSKQTGKNTKSTFLLTGESTLESDNKIDERCNIYDMAGNLLEWSTETYTDENTPCVYRGCYGGNDIGYTAYRIFSSLKSAGVGFRSILYL